MKFSAKCRYGLKAMYVLGENYGQLLSLGQLSSGSGVPEAFLEKILRSLKKGGFVSSNRGSMGGYFLSYPPQYITIGQILKCLEKNLFVSECTDGKCTNKLCPNRNVFGAIYGSISSLLDNMTLEQIILTKGDNK